MFDSLLGKAELKERIEELEAEKAHLEAQLSAEQERRSEAASERQTVEERANRLEDRIADLEGQLDRLQGEEGGLTDRGRETLTGGRLREVLDRLESFSTEPEGILTAVVREGGTRPREVQAAFGERAALVSRAAPCLAVADDAGLLSATLSVPDAPDPFAEWDDHVALDRSWFEPTGKFAFALVRSDLFALGVYEGRERTAFQGFDSDLKSQHSKGGFSQARFERLRDEQIADHVDRCRAALEDLPTDRLYVAGEAQLLGEFAADAAATQAVDATGDPEEALDDAFREFWTVRLRAI